MKLKAREMFFIKAGAVVAVALLACLLVLNPLRRKWAESHDAYRADRTAFLALRKDVNERLRLDSSIGSWEKKLAVKCQKGSADEQRQTFVKNIEQTAGKCNVRIAGINPRTVPGQRKKQTSQVGNALAFSLSAETDQRGLLKFLKELDAMGNPVAITNFEAKTDAKDPNKIQLALDFHTYLFDGSNP